MYDNKKALFESNLKFSDLYEKLFSDGERVMAETVGTYKTIKLTCAQAAERIDDCAKAIYSRFGCGKYIGLFGENSAEWLMLFWAILKSGNDPYLINTRQPMNVCRSVMATLGATEIIYVGEKSAEFCGEAVAFSELTCSEAIELPEFGNNIALTTSGTTGNVRICIYGGEAMSGEVINGLPVPGLNKKAFPEFKDNVKMLSILPFYHIFGLQASYFWFAMYGAVSVFPSGKGVQEAFRAARLSHATHIMAVPMFWNAVAKIASREKISETDINKSLTLMASRPAAGMKFAKKNFEDIRNKLLGGEVVFCVTGGSYIPRRTYEIVNALGYPLHNGFGMSETGVTSVELDQPFENRLNGSMGDPLRSAEYRIDDKGALEIRSSVGAETIITDGVAAPRDEWFKTGDLVAYDRDTYYFRSRLTDVVIGENGENLDPDMAESVFELHDALEYCVLGDENDKLLLVARIAPDLPEIRKQRLLREIQKGVSSLSPAYKNIRIAFTHAALAPAGAIKVSRTRLKAALAAGTVVLFEIAPSEESVCDGGELKEELRRMIAEVLGISPEDIADNAHFMHDLGGTSLDYFTLNGMINEKYDVKLSFEERDFGYSLNDFTKLTESLLK